MEIERQEDGNKGVYVLVGNDITEPADLTYTKLGNSSIIIDHTGVPSIYRGQGFGAKLVERAVEDARKDNKKIIPLCPFAAAQFKRHPEWADVLNQSAMTKN